MAEPNATPPTAQQVVKLWRDKYDEFQTTRGRVRDVRDWLAGKVDPVVPEGFAEAARLAVKLPHAITLALHTVQVLSRKRPRLSRTPLGKSVTARRKASELELWVNAALESIEAQHGKAWRPLVDFLFNQGQGAILVLPTTAGWEDFPSMFDEQGRVKSQFERNSAGQDRSSPSHKGAFRTSNKASKVAFDEYLTDYKSRRIPIAIRVLGVDQALPVFGPNFRLDGLIIRSEYAEEELKARGYRWQFGEAGGPGVGRDPDELRRGSLYPRFTLYEFVQPGRITYYIGKGTAQPHPDGSDVTPAYKQTEDGLEVPYVVDLAKDFGIERMPATWVWGAHFASESDPDVRGVPFIWPFLSAFAGSNNLATAKLAHTWQNAFGGWFITADKEAPAELVLEKGKPRKLKIEPMKAQYVAGVPQPAVHPGTNNDVDELMTLMMGAVKEEGPSSGAFGGPGASSGHDRSLVRAMLEDSFADVLQGALEGWSFVGELVAEIGDALVAEYKTPLPVYVSIKPSQTGRVRGATIRQALELTGDLCDGVYDFDADYPPQKGENLPFAQMLMEWSIQRRIPLRQALEEGMADEAPDETMIEILVEDLLFNTPQGRQYIYEIAASELGDDRMKELFTAVQNGQATPDGVPTAALPAGAQPSQPGAGQGALTGTAPTNPVQSALGGIIAGGLQTGALRNDAMATQGRGIPT